MKRLKEAREVKTNESALECDLTKTRGRVHRAFTYLINKGALVSTRLHMFLEITALLFISRERAKKVELAVLERIHGGLRRQWILYICHGCSHSSPTPRRAVLCGWLGRGVRKVSVIEEEEAAKSIRDVVENEELV
jgi:hypothetical protein